MGTAPFYIAAIPVIFAAALLTLERCHASTCALVDAKNKALHAPEHDEPEDAPTGDFSGDGMPEVISADEKVRRKLIAAGMLVPPSSDSSPAKTSSGVPVVSLSSPLAYSAVAASLMSAESSPSAESHPLPVLPNQPPLAGATAADAFLELREGTVLSASTQPQAAPAVERFPELTQLDDSFGNDWASSSQGY